MGVIKNQENYDKAYELVEKIKAIRENKKAFKKTLPEWLEKAKQFAATANI